MCDVGRTSPMLSPIYLVYSMEQFLSFDGNEMAPRGSPGSVSILM